MLRAALAATLIVLVGSAAGQDVAEVRLVRVEGDDEAPFAFEPARLTVPAGTTVTWVNERDVFHTVTFTDSIDRRVPNGTFDQSLTAAGDTVERTFDTPGSYAYFCQPHSPFMPALIAVTEPPDDDEWRWWAAGAAGVVVVAAVTYVLMRRSERRASPQRP